MPGFDLTGSSGPTYNLVEYVSLMVCQSVLSGGLFFQCIFLINLFALNKVNNVEKFKIDLYPNSPGLFLINFEISPSYNK